MVEKPMPEKKTITDTVKRLQLGDRAMPVGVTMPCNHSDYHQAEPWLWVLDNLEQRASVSREDS